jgi:predicted nucleotidyltransferase
MTAVATYPAAVAPLVDALLDGVSEALGDNFVGFYLCGSLALGGFDPETSDVDVLVVTGRPVSDAEFAALKELHESLPAERNEFSLDYDVYYVDLETIRRFAEGQRHVKVGTGEPFSWRQNRPNWALERWTVRERGVTVAGPDPKTLIDPVSPADLRSAASAELGARLQHWTDGSWPREELAHLGTQAFEIETVCRAMFTVEFGEVSSKRTAVEWALASLPERWGDLVEWSQAHKRDLTRDESKIPNVLELLAWAAEEAA